LFVDVDVGVDDGFEHEFDVEVDEFEIKDGFKIVCITYVSKNKIKYTQINVLFS
jgi:hypothetical protein